MNDDLSGTVDRQNVASILTAAGKTWKCYAESLPAEGVSAGDLGDYVRRHVPFAYFDNVVHDPAQAAQVVPFTQFPADLAGGSVPNYAFIVPNQLHNGHDCPSGQLLCTEQDQLEAYDHWLQANIKPLLEDPAFQSTLLILTWDEAQQSDIEHGGGHIATVLASPKIKAGFRSTGFYQHENVLRLSLRALGITNLPGKAASATDMTEFFP
jgi:acid phosphatase